MKEEERKEIEKIVSGMQCSKNFECAENDFEHLCKARDFVLEEYLECVEDNPSLCQFSVHLGYRHFCKCPLRVYLTKRLKK